MKPLRMHIVWEVLECAKANNDAMVLDAARRLIRANTIGWKKHHDPKDWALVQAFAQ